MSKLYYYYRNFMNKEKLAVTLFALYGLSTLAFSRGSRKEIKQRNGNICEQCGEKIKEGDGVAGHIDHNQDNPNYNLPMNGQSRHRVCEAKIHIQYAFEPKILGMKARDARSAAWGWYCDLSFSERQELPKSFTPIINRLREMYNH